MKSLFAIVMIAMCAAFAFGQNESAPMIEKEFDYKDWTYADVRTGEDVNLRKFTQGKKLVMAVYFAGWCPNWRHDAPFVKRMYDKYHAQGFDVIGVGEYDSAEAIKNSLDKFQLKFPAVSESVLRTDKQNTLHYNYRKAVGDTRNWGSPWYVFLEPGKLEKGEVLARRANVVNGELIEAEVEKFIREKLGLDKASAPGELTASKAIEVCEPEIKTAAPAKP